MFGGGIGLRWGVGIGCRREILGRLWRLRRRVGGFECVVGRLLSIGLGLC